MFYWEIRSKILVMSPTVRWYHCDIMQAVYIIIFCFTPKIAHGGCSVNTYIHFYIYFI